MRSKAETDSEEAEKPVRDIRTGDPATLLG